MRPAGWNASRDTRPDRGRTTLDNPLRGWAVPPCGTEAPRGFVPRLVTVHRLRGENMLANKNGTATALAHLHKIAQEWSTCRHTSPKHSGLREVNTSPMTGTTKSEDTSEERV